MTRFTYQDKQNIGRVRRLAAEVAPGLVATYPYVQVSSGCYGFLFRLGSKESPGAFSEEMIEDLDREWQLRGKLRALARNLGR